MDVLFIVGQSGSGKTSLAKAIDEKYGLTPHKSVTTRPRRPSDKGDEYDFVDYDGFMSLLAKGDLIEYTQYCGQLYGMKAPDESCVLVVEPAGYVMVKRWCDMNAVRTATIYLTCDEQERLRRMTKRGDSRERALERVVSDRYFDKFMHRNVYDWKIDTTGIDHKETLHAACSRLETMQFFTFDQWHTP